MPFVKWSNLESASGGGDNAIGKIEMNGGGGHMRLRRVSPKTDGGPEEHTGLRAARSIGKKNNHNKKREESKYEK